MAVKEGQSIARWPSNIENTPTNLVLHRRAHFLFFQPVSARRFIRYGSTDPSLYVRYLKLAIRAASFKMIHLVQRLFELVDAALNVLDAILNDRRFTARQTLQFRQT